MTTDPSTACIGSKVRLRCGGEATVLNMIDRGGGQVALDIGGGPRSLLWWNRDGHFTSAGEHPFDIIAIEPPPLTEVERLAGIAALAEAEWKHLQDNGGVAQSFERMSRILILAEGRKS